MIIGVTGLIGSGKGEVVGILNRKKGYEVLGHSREIDEELRIRGLEVVRDNQVTVGNEMREMYGAGYWARRLVDKVEKCPGNNFAVEGFRNVAEIDEFRKMNDFVLLGVAAGGKQRYGWIIQRARHGDPRDYSGFLEVQKRDLMQDHASGQQNALCFALADYYILNEGHLIDLEAQVDLFLSKLK